MYRRTIQFPRIDHHRQSPFFYCGLKRRQIVFAQFSLRNPSWGAILATQWVAVTQEMFHAGRHVPVINSHISVLTLIPKDTSRCHGFGQINVLAVRLKKPRPQGLSAQIQYGRKVPWNPRNPTFQSGDFSTLQDQIGIPCSGLANLLREQCATHRVVNAVYRIDPKQYGNLRT